MVKKVICMGECLLRLMPDEDGNWLRENQMAVSIGGAEMNVAFALAKNQVPVSVFTVLPEHYVGQQILRELQSAGIDTGPVVFAQGRMGMYFLPAGSELRNSGVIYDRAGSTFCRLKAGEIPWDRVLEEADWLHFSAITPALNQELALVCEEMISVASRREMKISVDLNYRARLWNYGTSCPDIMRPLVSRCHLVMGNPWAIEALLGIPVEQDPGGSSDYELYRIQARRSARLLMQEFPSVKQVAQTFRFRRGEGVEYFATLDDEQNQVYSQLRIAEKIRDQVGTGDLFMAGLLRGIRAGHAPGRIVEEAAGAAFEKFFVVGDHV